MKQSDTEAHVLCVAESPESPELSAGVGNHQLLPLGLYWWEKTATTMFAGRDSLGFLYIEHGLRHTHSVQNNFSQSV